MRLGQNDRQDSVSASRLYLARDNLSGQAYDHFAIHVVNCRIDRETSSAIRIYVSIQAKMSGVFP
jgi:hypothetical protein